MCSSPSSLPLKPERLEATSARDTEAAAGIGPAIAGLPLQQRIILALRDHGLTYEEIASHLGVPTGTVHSRIFRARRRMRRQEGIPLSRQAQLDSWPAPVQDDQDGLWRDASPVL